MERRAKTVLLAFDSPNSLFPKLEKHLKRGGFDVDLQAISSAEAGELAKGLRALPPHIKEADLIVTDGTLHDKISAIAKPHKKPVINAFSFVPLYRSSPEGHVQFVKPIVDKIRAGGKTPVVLLAELTTHSFGLKDDVKEDLQHEFPHLDLGKPGNPYSEAGQPSQDAFARLLHKHLNVPAISRKYFDLDYRDADENGRNRMISSEGNNLHDGIRQLGLDPKKVVLLSDHHVVKYGGRHKPTNTLFEGLTVQLICACCAYNKSEAEAYTDYGVPMKLPSFEEDLVKEIKRKLAG
jgi:hypothetical protein